MTRGVSSGGFCVLKGVPTVFIDERASVDAQIEILAGVLRRFDWSAVSVHPAVRPLLGLDRPGARATAISTDTNTRRARTA